MGIKTGVMEGAENTPGNGIPLTSLKSVLYISSWFTKHCLLRTKSVISSKHDTIIYVPSFRRVLY
jgi:hypothetical protein